jgi:hypothetical protein
METPETKGNAMSKSAEMAATVNEWMDKLVEALEFSNRVDAAEAAAELAKLMRRPGAVAFLDRHSMEFIFDSFSDLLRR